MAQKCFDLMDQVFELMAENELKKDIDDTLLEKLLTLIQLCRLQSSDGIKEIVLVEHKIDTDLCSDFIEELMKRTKAPSLIKKVLSSVAAKDENYSTVIKSFVIRFLGFVFANSEGIIPYETVLALLKHTDGAFITDHIPSVQDALLFCLSCITENFKGTLWFVDQNLKEFVFSHFNASSYYVRKTSVHFFVDFISRWISGRLSQMDQKNPKELDLESFVKNLVSYMVDHIPFYRTSREMVFAECCIDVLKELLELDNVATALKDQLNSVKNISDCFMNLTEEKEFNKKLIDLFITIRFKFALPDEVINDAIKCLVLKEEIKLAMELASSFASNAWPKNSCSDEIHFFLLPVYILLNTPLTNHESFFTVKSDHIYNVVLKKMEEKSDCKSLFSSSLCALQKVVLQLNSDLQRSLGLEMLKIVKCSNFPPHKWLYSVLQDRLVHHSLIEFYSSLLSEDVYLSMELENSDLVFQNIMEFLKKSTSDTNFLSQLLLLMKDVIILHKKYKFVVEESERHDLIQILCKVLLDNRESVVDSAIQLTGEVSNLIEWQDELSKQGIHSIIWDIAIKGSFDGAVRSTALNVIINTCLEGWCLNEIKSLKGVTEADIVKILYELTSNPDFFLQREALSCLFLWMKSKWNELQPSCRDYLYAALVSAIKGLDSEMKFLSLDAWEWLLENKFQYSAISPSLDIKEYIGYLATTGFGVSLIHCLQDCDRAVELKAAKILFGIKKSLISSGYSFNNVEVDFSNEYMQQSMDPENMAEPISKEERDKCIDTVMELSVAEQITNICHSSSSLEMNDFKQECVPNISERTCTIDFLWESIWIIKMVSVSDEPTVSDVESVLKDIISARIMEHETAEDTPDCY